MPEFGTQSPDSIVIRALLLDNAERTPDEEFIFFEDGVRWTRAMARDEAARVANSLRAQGIEQGDRVSVLLLNGPDFLRVWWGAALLGAILVPINTAYRGALLHNVVDVVAPKLLVTNEALSAVVQDAHVTTPMLMVGDLGNESSEIPELSRPVRHWDPELLVLTSGTTGPSKLVATSYLQNYLGGSHYVTPDHGPAERFLVDLPMFHSAMIYMITACLQSGATMAVREYPAMSNYWEVARDTGATMSVLLSSMLPFLLSQPERDAEREHSVRSIIVAPVPPGVERLRERYGITTVKTIYGSTEIPGVLLPAEGDTLIPGGCGRVRPGFQARLVDEYDIEVPVGEPGELIVRTERPWAMMTEYADNPEATSEAWRNGWFHTGDMFRKDDGGQFFFVDRVKDALRRRGENISSFEVESVVAQSPAVAEVACVPYRLAEGTDDEVKIWVVPADADTFNPEELFRYCVEALPHFMVPRFIETVDVLPKTPSTRVKKAELRELGNSTATWDAHEQGLRMTRSGLDEVK